VQEIKSRGKSFLLQMFLPQFFYKNFQGKDRKERDTKSPTKKLQFYLYWNIQGTRLIWSRCKWQNSRW
jgi:hypothetical protein